MPTTIKQALKMWEEASGCKSEDSNEIRLIGVTAPTEKMEGPFHLLADLEQLSLCTNQAKTKVVFMLYVCDLWEFVIGVFILRSQQLPTSNRSST